MNDIYGQYRTRTFGEIFPNVNDFDDFYTNCGIPATLLTGTDYANYSIGCIYALLCSEYFGAHIAYSSEDWFKLKVMQTIFAFGPTWQREMAIQAKLQKLTDETLKLGSTAVYNHAAHPSTEPSDASLDELTFIDDQNVTRYKKDPMKAFTEATLGLDDKLTQVFLNRFRKLFIKFIYPLGNTYYESEE